MIAEDQNKSLIILANSASINPVWIDYVNYCFNREKGLRKEAFNSLNIFLKSTESWTFEQKKDFINFLFPIFETVKDADYGGFPQPLSEKLIKPTLLEWCKVEQEDNNPFRWYGKYFRSEEHLFKAIELDSTDDLARTTLISWWSYNLYYSVHHLPDYYIGDPEQDILLSEDIKRQIAQLTSPETRNNWTRELEEDLILIENYITWKKSNHPNFDEWGKENNKSTGYGLIRTYYYNKD